ncbi:pyruvate kinase [Kaustia mangrovi]|uniref:Pyruvate kinase n=1 Tax=Kaustia mangrovi TaxID=2593653 RepID=A0A7S8HB21_9HYPH|nr:pyruvate kinase [Kaustia mangrovi]QPC42177.1 pyruvate kinase [Kaustia mangrovi]
MRRERRVKILATLGPASSSAEMISELFDCGADAFRINMSHTSHEELRTLHRTIRDVETQKRRPICILVDLQGPKFRIGRFADGEIQLEPGDTFVLDMEETPGDTSRVELPHPQIFQAVAPGDTLLLNDGRLGLAVREVDETRIVTEVEIGGPLSDRKGVNLPDTVLPLSALTPKDRSDLDCALDLDVDWIALSFIQRADDVAEAKKVARGRAAIMAKIEKPAALGSLDQILELADGIMVARGDLGVELPLEQVPGRQKQIVRAARRIGRPVVVATQMLESMIEQPVPTRAEVSDVATAVFEGADAIMLSAESAVGAYPDKAVAMMDDIAQAVEKDPFYGDIIHAQRTEPEPTSADAISAAARTVAQTLNLAAIVCYTSSGATGIRAARERPATPIVALTPIAATGRRLALVWGLHCVLTADARDLDDMVARACRIAYQEGYARAGQRIIISAGFPLGTPGATNMLRIAFVGRDGMEES